MEIEGESVSSSQTERALEVGGGGKVLENEQGRTQREEGGGGQNSGILSERTFECPLKEYED